MLFLCVHLDGTKIQNIILHDLCVIVNFKCIYIKSEDGGGELKAFSSFVALLLTEM